LLLAGIVVAVELHAEIVDAAQRLDHREDDGFEGLPERAGEIGAGRIEILSE
jgi:hypothetical protein